MPSRTTTRLATPSQWLNIGCGRRYHRDWTNVDLEASDDHVIQHDINRGLPFADNHFSAVYHSHVLEHLSPEDGERLLRECHRVLSPGGVLRIVVPDLEQIARLYLKVHERAWQNDQQPDADYQWIKLELLDQLVRGQSGGRMGKYMSDGKIANEAFVRSRLGDEFTACREHDGGAPHRSFSAKIQTSMAGFKKNVTRRLVRWIMGKEAQLAFDEGLFRSQGEIHRWMYDRYSLKQLCEQVGLKDFRVCDAAESRILDFQRFQLDTVDGKVRKPDSLFVEAIKAT